MHHRYHILASGLAVALNILSLIVTDTVHVQGIMVLTVCYSSLAVLNLLDDFVSALRFC
jgi:CBS-domain-containing membrane protein